jgi:hypothetical protein
MSRRLALAVAPALHLGRASCAGGYLRLMNGRYPKGEPVAGQTLKIVQ